MTTAKQPDQQPPMNQATVAPAAPSLSTVITQALGASVPIAAIGSGLAYVLGRAYLGAYYREFNIPLNALELNTVDHLFASTDTIVASLVSGIIIWYGYHFRDSFMETLLARFNVISYSLLALLIVSINIVYSGILAGPPGLNGIVIGVALGPAVALYPVIWAGASIQFPKLQKVLPVVFVAAGAALFVSFSFMAKELGAVQAFRSGKELPVALVRLANGKEIPELFRSIDQRDTVPLKIVAGSKVFIFGLDLRQCETQPKRNPIWRWFLRGFSRSGMLADCARVLAIPLDSVAGICYGKVDITCSRPQNSASERPPP